MTLDPTRSLSLNRVSPSLFHDLTACALRVAFGRQEHGAVGVVHPAAILGTLCHAVLEEMVVTKAFWAADWTERLTETWSRRAVESQQAYPLLGPAESWPGFQIKRARLKPLLERLRALIGDAETDDLFTEVELWSRDQTLFGRADLVVRGATSLVIDYK